MHLNTGLRLDTYEAVSYIVGMMLDTIKLFFKLQLELECVQSSCRKVARCGQFGWGVVLGLILYGI